MLRMSNLTLARGNKRLLDGASLTVHPGHKVGLIGANGSGKSRCSRCCAASSRGRGRGRAAAGLGDRARRAGNAGGRGAGDRLRPRRRRRIARDRSARCRTPKPRRKPIRMPAASSSPSCIIASRRSTATARVRAPRALLVGPRLRAARQSEPVASFSGGWRMRLNLAQALMCRSDLLLLDEPTNHLDLDAVLWLEDWLERYPGTLLLITHDRDFLDAVVTEIVHLEGNKLRLYTGNYTPVRARARAGAGAAAVGLRQAAEADRAPALVHRSLSRQGDQGQAGAKPDQGARAHGVDRRGARRQSVLVRISGHHASTRDSCSSSITRRSAMASKPILTDVDWAILAGARIGLLGPNGAGKSTLLRAIAGELAACERRAPRRAGPAHRLFRPAPGRAASPRPESRCGTCSRSSPARASRSCAIFSAASIFAATGSARRCGEFSGGEKARLTLALLVRQRPNLLLLDEPTNHLDIDMREALTEALQDYDRRADRRRARPPPAARHRRRAVAGRRRRACAVRRRSGRLPPLGAGRTRARGRGDGGRCRSAGARPQDAKARRGRGAAAPVGAAQTAAAEARPHRADGSTRCRREKRGLDDWLATPDAYIEENKERLIASLARQRRPGLGARARRGRMARAARSARARSRLKARFAPRSRYALTGAGVSAPGVGSFHGATRNSSAMPGSASAMHSR